MGKKGKRSSGILREADFDGGVFYGLSKEPVPRMTVWIDIRYIRRLREGFSAWL